MEPVKDVGDGAGKMRGCSGKGGARGVDGPIIDVEGEVLAFPPHGVM